MKIKRDGHFRFEGCEMNVEFETTYLSDFLYKYIKNNKDELLRNNILKEYCDIVYALNKMEEIIKSQSVKLRAIDTLRIQLNQFLKDGE